MLDIQIHKVAEKSGKDIQTHKKRATAASNDNAMSPKSFDRFHICCCISTAEPIKGPFQCMGNESLIEEPPLRRYL